MCGNPSWRWKLSQWGLEAGSIYRASFHEVLLSSPVSESLQVFVHLMGWETSPHMLAASPCPYLFVSSPAALPCCGGQQGGEVTLEQLAMLPSGENKLWSGLWQERRCAWGVLPCLRDLSLASRMARDCCPHCRQVFSFSCGLGWPRLPVLLGTSCCSPDKAWLSSGSWKDSIETASLVFFTRRTAIESFKRLNNNACSRSVSLTAKYCGENNTPSLSCL